jgi:hypothetical protein
MEKFIGQEYEPEIHGHGSNNRHNGEDYVSNNPVMHTNGMPPKDHGKDNWIGQNVF